MKDDLEYQINICKTEGTDEWMASFPEINGCVGGGATPEEALKEARINLRAHINFMNEEGYEIPSPRKVRK